MGREEFRVEEGTKTLRIPLSLLLSWNWEERGRKVMCFPVLFLTQITNIPMHLTNKTSACWSMKKGTVMKVFMPHLSFLSIFWSTITRRRITFLAVPFPLKSNTFVHSPTPQSKPGENLRHFDERDEISAPLFLPHQRSNTFLGEFKILQSIAYLSTQNSYP